MSNFDPAAFLDATTTEALVKRPPLPVGDYTAVVGEIVSRAWQGKADPTQSGIAFDIPLAMEVPADVQASLGLSTATINLRDSIMVDLTAEGAIDYSVGKNRRLRMYREALNLNTAGQPFAPRMMTGGVLKVKLTHGVWEGEPIEKVSGVAKA